MMGRTLVALVCAAIVALPSHAQLSASITPVAPQPGQPVSIVLTENQGTDVFFLDGCIVDRARFGSPHGALAWTPQACPDIYIHVPPYGSVSHVWPPPGVRLEPGPYALRVSYRTGGSMVLESHWYTVTWTDDERVPALVPWNDPLIGNEVRIALEAPDHPAGFYVAAASSSTDKGYPLGASVPTALDDGLLFRLSWPDPHPFLFRGLHGYLDKSGSSTSIGVLVPADPSFLHVGFAVQAAVWDYCHDGPAMTNVLYFTIGH